MLKSRHLVVIALCLLPAAADAQTLPAMRTFVDVTVGPDWDDAYNTRSPDVTWRSGIAFGVDWGRSGVEINVSVPQWHVGRLGPYTYKTTGSTFGWQQQGHVYEWSSTIRRRSIDVTVLYRGNVPLHRSVTFSWLAGGGYVYRPEHATGTTMEVLPGGQLTEVNVTKNTSFRNYPVGAARLEVEFRVAPYLSVVPRLRATVFPAIIDESPLAPRILVVRPEFAVRWQF